MNDHNGGLRYLARTLASPTYPFTNTGVRILSVLARNRSSEQVDTPSAKGFTVGVPAKPRGSEIPLSAAAVGKRSLRVLPEESPHIEVLDSTIPVDEMPGGTLAEANEHQAILVEAAVSVGILLEEVLEVNDRDLSEPVEVVRFKRFLRPLRYPVRLGSFVSGHDSEGRAIGI